MTTNFDRFPSPSPRDEGTFVCEKCGEILTIEPEDVDLDAVDDQILCPACFDKEIDQNARQAEEATDYDNLKRPE